jgi:SAM-dependent methyltransferase
VDIAPTAIELARAKAADRRLKVRFLVLDALNLSDLGQLFDTVLDCGLFHVLDDNSRALFVQSLASIVPPGGRYHMLCFSDREPGDWGPRRITQAEIRASFADGWVVDTIEPAVIEINVDPVRVQAWHATAVRG